MKNLLCFVLVFSVTISTSCKKDPKINEPSHSDSIIVGDTTSSEVIINDFTPVIFVQGSKVGSEDLFTNHDTIEIDLNGDEDSDIMFEYYRYYNNTNSCEECQPSIIVKNTIKVLKTNVHLIVDSSGKYVQKMNSDDEVSISNNLNKDSVLILSIAGTLMPNEGEWSNSDYNYIGFIYNGEDYNQYGWIMVNCHLGLYGISIKRVGITD